VTAVLAFGAIAPAANAETAYVVTGSGSVIPVDVATDTAEASIQTSAYPSSIAITPDGSQAFLPNLFEGTVTPINLATRTPGAQIPVGEGPSFVAITPDGSTAYVSDEWEGKLTPIDVATDTAEAPISVSEVGDLVITPDGSTAYVLQEHAGSVLPVNLAIGIAGTPIDVGRSPDGIAITPDGRTVYVANEGSQSVTPIDVATNTAGPEIGVGVNPHGVAVSPDGSKVYVANPTSHSITTINAANNSVGTTISLGAAAFVPAFSDDGTKVFATLPETHALASIDVATSTAGSPIPLGEEPIWVAFAPKAVAAGAPSAPSALSGTFADGKIELGWTAPDNEGAGPISHYVIHPMVEGAELPAVETPTTSTSYSYEPADGLLAGRTYTFTVTAVNSLGEGPATPQAVVRVGVGVPSAPTGVTAAPFNEGANLSWSAPTNDGGAPIEGYEVTTIDDDGVESAPISIPAATTSYSVTGLTNGQSYTFKVAAVNEAGAGEKSQPSTPVTVHGIYSIRLSEPYLEGTMGDPTNPTVNVIVGEEGAEASTLSVEATATSDATVAAVSGVTVSGTGATRTVSITPAGRVGTAEITLQVTGPEGGAATIVLRYAASTAVGDPATTRYHTGAADGSTAIDAGDGYMIVGDDEDNTLRLYKDDVSGPPVKEWSFESRMGNPAEIDIEASARAGDTIYWTGSMGNSKSGNLKPERSTLFTTQISGEGAAAELTFGGYYTGLRQDLIEWDQANGNRFGFAAGSARGKVPKEIGGFNAEGMEFVQGSTETAYIGFRAPLVPATANGDALLVPVTNIDRLATSGLNSSVHATFGEPLELDLGGLGVREIRKNANGEYLIIAGPWSASGAQALYTWDGVRADQPVRALTAIPDSPGGEEAGAWEGIASMPSRLVSGEKVMLVMDDGAADLYGTGEEAKELVPEWEKSPSDTFTLEMPAVAPVEKAAPILSGTTVEGSVLTCEPGTWTGEPAPTITYAWLRDGVAIAGAEEATYSSGAGDVGDEVACEVTATNTAGSASAESNAIRVSKPTPVEKEKSSETEKPSEKKSEEHAETPASNGGPSSSGGRPTQPVGTKEKSESSRIERPAVEAAGGSVSIQGAEATVGTLTCGSRACRVSVERGVVKVDGKTFKVKVVGIGHLAAGGSTKLKIVLPKAVVKLIAAGESAEASIKVQVKHGSAMETKSISVKLRGGRRQPK